MQQQQLFSDEAVRQMLVIQEDFIKRLLCEIKKTRTVKRIHKSKKKNSRKSKEPKKIPTMESRVKRWSRDNTKIAKIFQYISSHEPVPCDQVESVFESVDSENPGFYTRELIRSDVGMTDIFIRQNGMFSLTSGARDFHQSLFPMNIVQ